MCSATAKPKIDELDYSFLINDDVLELDVSVSNLLLMQVDKDIQQLSNNILALLLRQSFERLGFQMGVQRVALHILHD